MKFQIDSCLAFSRVQSTAQLLTCTDFTPYSISNVLDFTSNFHSVCITTCEKSTKENKYMKKVPKSNLLKHSV